MPDIHNERVVRAMLAGLLNSSLTKRELRDVANRLSHGEFAYDLGRALAVTLGELQSQMPIGMLPDSARASREHALDQIQRKRLPKQEVIRLMLAATRNRDNFIPQSSRSVRELVSNFFNLANPNEISTFEILLENPKQADPYLKGIVGRR